MPQKNTGMQRDKNCRWRPIDDLSADQIGQETDPPHSCRNNPALPSPRQTYSEPHPDTDAGNIGYSSIPKAHETVYK
jgi:hypothetical protein